MSEEVVLLSLPNRQSPQSVTHTLLCFSSSEDLRGELEKEEKGTMVVVKGSSHYLAMQRIQSLPMSFLWALCMFVPSACLPLLSVSASSSLPPNSGSLRLQWDL